MKAEPTRQSGFTLFELLFVIIIIVFLLVSLIVLARQFRIHSQVQGTRALMERLANANEQFHSDWKFYAPDSPIPDLGGRSWAVAAAPEIPDEVEKREVDTDAPGMPGGKMPTSGNEYMMINLVLRGRYLRIQRASLAGPMRGLDLGKFEKHDVGRTTTRCIIVDSWARPFFYDCHKPEGTPYVNGAVRHNASAFDLFSIGPDGRTASADPGGGGGYAMGEAPDDLNNWQGTNNR